MDPIRDVQDVSIAASERGAKKHDVSIGQSVIFMDASANHSLNMHDASVNHSLSKRDVSINADRASQRDVSIDQTQRFNE